MKFELNNKCIIIIYNSNTLLKMLHKLNELCNETDMFSITQGINRDAC